MAERSEDPQATATMTSVAMTSLENGPNLVHGPVHLIGAGGRELEHREPFALCRCVSEQAVL